jgi:hypothetical protein
MSTATTPRSSSFLDYTKSAFEVSTTSLTSTTSTTTDQRSSSNTSKPQSRTRQLWTALKRHVKEHHESVNAVYENMYGYGYGRRVVLGEEGVRRVRWTAEGKGPELWVYQRGTYGA